MNISRRGFLASILAAGVAPAIVGSGILMPIRKVWTPWSYDFAPMLTMTLDEFSQRYMKPAMQQLADDIDARIALHYVETWTREAA